MAALVTAWLALLPAFPIWSTSGLETMAFALAFIVAPLAGTYIYEALGPRALWQAIGILGVGLWMSVAPLRHSLSERRVTTSATE